jgi:hypothetical protein
MDTEQAPSWCRYKKETPQRLRNITQHLLLANETRKSAPRSNAQQSYSHACMLDRAASIHDRNEVCLTLRATAAALELCPL